MEGYASDASRDDPRASPESPLYRAVLNGDEVMASLLLEWGADVNRGAAAEQRTPLEAARKKRKQQPALLRLLEDPPRRTVLD